MESGPGTVDAGGVVRIGSVVFALIRPGAGREQAFNHWYERDHYYTTGTAAPGVFSAARFVQPDSGLHLALYLVLPGFEKARIAFATEQVETAMAEDRMFADREHLHTWGYAPSGAWRADPDGVPPALALDHRYAAMTVVMVDGEPPDLDALLGGGGHDLDLVLALAPVEAIMPSTWEGSADVSRRTTLLGFHRHDASTGPDVFASLADREGFVWIESFVPVVFGTDTHIPG